MSRFEQANTSKRRKTAAAVESTAPDSFDVTKIALIIPNRKLVQKLNSFLIPQMVARHGYRWHNAHVNASLLNLVREAVIRTGIMPAGAYDAQRPKNYESKLLTHLRKSNAHAFSQHHRIVRGIVRKLFEIDPDDEVMVKVKERVFGKTAGHHLMHPQLHPVMAAMQKEFVLPGEFFNFV